MKIRHRNLAVGVARLLCALSILFACLTLFTESAQAQRPARTPIEDAFPAGEPQRVELEGGKYKLVYRNKAGQVIEEEEYALGVKVSRKSVLSICPNGQEARVVITNFDPVKGETGTGVTVSADSGVGPESAVRRNPLSWLSSDRQP